VVRFFFGHQIKDGFAIPEKKQLLDPMISRGQQYGVQTFAKEFLENIAAVYLEDSKK